MLGVRKSYDNKDVKKLMAVAKKLCRAATEDTSKQRKPQKEVTFAVEERPLDYSQFHSLKLGSSPKPFYLPEQRATLSPTKQAVKLLAQNSPRHQTVDQLLDTKTSFRIPSLAKAPAHEAQQEKLYAKMVRQDTRRFHQEKLKNKELHLQKQLQL